MIASHAYEFVQWTPQTRGLYESNYLKANSPDGRRGIWLKHNILAPANGGAPAVLELWCVVFDKDKGRPVALKQCRPMSELSVSRDEIRIEGDGVLLTDHSTQTRLVDEESGARASWDLTLTSRERPLFHLPHDRLYTLPFPKKKLITPAPRLIFDGTLELDGETMTIDQWVGIRGHNWGTEHAYSYAYGNCNLFAEDDEALIDMYTAKIRLGPLKSPWLSGGVLRVGGVDREFNSLRHAVTRKATVRFPRWRVDLKGRNGDVLSTEWELDPEQTIGLRYLHPDGKVSHCYNTKFARVRLQLDDLELTSDQAELEFLFEDPIAGIPLYGGSEAG